MKLNLFKRSMIFATFFGSCLCIALIVASLGTTHWVDATARRQSNPTESEGRINFGLFEGHKAINFRYGWRHYDLSVLFTMGAMAVWLTEFFLRLQYNVMSDEDLANTWTSDSTADLGLSFWLVVAACISAFVNNVCILIAMADARDADTVAPALEEKVNGAIMLY